MKTSQKLHHTLTAIQQQITAPPNISAAVFVVLTLIFALFCPEEEAQPMPPYAALKGSLRKTTYQKHVLYSSTKRIGVIGVRVGDEDRF